MMADEGICEDLNYGIFTWTAQVGRIALLECIAGKRGVVYITLYGDIDLDRHSQLWIGFHPR